MNIEKWETTLNTGQRVWHEYDRESDLLEIFFQRAEATCALELTENIVLRFHWESNEPLSLSFIGISRLIQPTKYGEVYFQLLVNEWPDDVREKIWTILRKPPLNEFLKVSSYTPAHTQQVIPTATIKHLDVLPRAA